MGSTVSRVPLCSTAGHIQEASCSADLWQEPTSIALINSVRGLRVVERVDDRPLQESEAAVAQIRRAWMEVVERRASRRLSRAEVFKARSVWAERVEVDSLLENQGNPAAFLRQNH